jgi:chorismate mutase/prephenate dehydrogenase
MTELDTLRNALAEVDRRLIEAIAARQTIARAIGQRKEAEASGLRDFAQEKRVLERGRSLARDAGVGGDLAERVLELCIEASLTAQEEQRVTHRSGGSGKRVLVIGGGGRMGSWLVGFLLTQGFRVEVADPAGTDQEVSWIADWRDSPLDHDLVIVTAPLRASAIILHELAGRRPGGVVLDVGSLKAPLQGGLGALRAAGVRVTSIHPLFGPDTRLLAGRHVVIVDLGVPEANAAARALFAPTMAEVVTMDLERHDRIMARVLGLSHALNIAFLGVLAGGDSKADELARLSSTTFARQLAVATPVARENPRLYFEIQHLNPFGVEVLDALALVVARLRDTIRSGDEAGFVGLMEAGRRWSQAETKVCAG